MVLNPHSDLCHLVQLQVTGQVRLPMYCDAGDILRLTELDTEGCQCHRLPEHDMDGGRFEGVCNRCEQLTYGDSCRLEQAPMDWERRMYEGGGDPGWGGYGRMLMSRMRDEVL